MAEDDKVFGFKVTKEFYDRLKVLIENSGGTAKDWIEKAANIVELQTVKIGSAEYTQDLNELEVHTQRIYELITNMIQRSIYMRDQALKEVTDKLEQKESAISEYQARLARAADDAQLADIYTKELTNANDSLLKQLDELRSSNETKDELNKEYKERIDTLSGLVNEYKGYRDEIEDIQASRAHDVKALQEQIKQQEDELYGLKQQIQTLTADHSMEIEKLTGEKDIEREKSLAAVERQYQAKLEKANNEYAAKIIELQEKLEKANSEYSAKIIELQGKLEKANSDYTENMKNFYAAQMQDLQKNSKETSGGRRKQKTEPEQ